MNGPSMLMFPPDNMAGVNWRPVREFPVDMKSFSTPADRAKVLRFAGHAFHERFMDEPQVAWARSVRLQRVPYPAWYAFNGVNAQRVVSGGMVHLAARVLIVQFEDFSGKLKTLLFNPHDIERGVQTPFFSRLSASLPKAVTALFAPVDTTVPQALFALGTSLDAIDYIAYDHLHTQDLRRWLGDRLTPGLFPNARLLVHYAEWRSAHGLLPTQADWYCPNGIEGVPKERVCCFDGSLQLGRGLALIHTPGHTAGNCSIVYRAPDGVRVSSENGVSSDSWYPRCSQNNAIRRYANATGCEVILNGNTQENSIDQYLSMILEKAIVGHTPSDEIGTAIPSSECAPHWLFSAPQTHVWGDTNFGRLRKV